jgi:hypothetical protein
MPERHRGNPREFDRDRGRGYSGRGDFGGPAGPGGRDRRSGPPGPGGPGGPGGPPPRPESRTERSFEPPDLHRDRRPPAPPEEMDEFEDVDAQLAVAIIEAATKLTEIVGTAGLPESYTERRETVVESFETIYFALLDAITGADEEDEENVE